MPARRPRPTPLTPPRKGTGDSDSAFASGHRRRTRPSDSGYVVKASELGQYAYCRRAWWYRYVAHVEPSRAGQARLDAGTLRHAEHGQGVAWAATLWRVGIICAVLAAGLAVLALVGLLLIH